MLNFISSCTLLIIGLPLTTGVCGYSIGSDNNGTFQGSGTKRLYLNTARPAGCNGVIRDINYCYYGPSKYKKNVDLYQATIAIYRTSDKGQSYGRVSDVTTISKWNPSSSVQPSQQMLLGFNCDTYSLSSEIQVLEDDVIGACIFDQVPHSMELPLVAESAMDGYSMLYLDERTAGCETNVLPDVVNNLRVDPLLKVLHVSARIHVGPHPIANASDSPPGELNQGNGSTVSMNAERQQPTPTPLSLEAMTSTTSLETSQFTTNQPKTAAIPRTLETKISVTKALVEMSRAHYPNTTTLGDSAENKVEVVASTTTVVGEMAAAYTTEQSGRQMISSGLHATLVAGVCGGVLLFALMVTVLIPVAILVAWKRKRKSRTQTLRVNESSVNLISTSTGNTARVLQRMNGTGNGQPEVTVNNQLQVQEQQKYQHLANQHGTVRSQPPNDVEDHDEHFYHVLEGPKCPYSELLKKNKSEDIYSQVAKFLEPAQQEEDLYTQIKYFGIRNIHRSSIQIGDSLGSGQFGSVKRALWKTGKVKTHIAVKDLSQSSSEAVRVKFLQEAAIMAQFRHPNITSLYGVVSKDEPIMLVVELVEKGDLCKYLNSLKQCYGADGLQLSVSAAAGELPNLLLSFSQHVALGMQYLSGKGFVHRDLAARNILVSKDNVCKIADFGMSRDLADETYYISRGGEVPVKWTAPEAIHYKKYSTASDVWSYGCLLYEIWSLGHMPFEKMENLEVIKNIDKGIRLAPPPGCSREVYELMIHTWHPLTGGRPTFRGIVLTLTDIQETVLLSPRGSENAGVLSSSLFDGVTLYRDLQDKYLIHLI